MFEIKNGKKIFITYPCCIVHASLISQFSMRESNKPLIIQMLTHNFHLNIKFISHKEKIIFTNGSRLTLHLNVILNSFLLPSL